MRLISQRSVTPAQRGHLGDLLKFRQIFRVVLADIFDDACIVEQGAQIGSRDHQGEDIRSQTLFNHPVLVLYASHFSLHAHHLLAGQSLDLFRFRGVDQLRPWRGGKQCLHVNEGIDS